MSFSRVREPGYNGKPIRAGWSFFVDTQVRRLFLIQSQEYRHSHRPLTKSNRIIHQLRMLSHPELLKLSLRNLAINARHTRPRQNAGSSKPSNPRRIQCLCGRSGVRNGVTHVVGSLARAQSGSHARHPTIKSGVIPGVARLPMVRDIVRLRGGTVLVVGRMRRRGGGVPTGQYGFPRCPVPISGVPMNLELEFTPGETYSSETNNWNAEIFHCVPG